MPTLREKPDACAASVRVGATTGSLLSSLASNTARNIGDYANPDPQFNQINGSTCVNLAGASIADFSHLRYDSANGRMLIFGGGHVAEQETDIRALDMTALTWSSLYQSTPASAMLNNPGNADNQIGRWISSGQPTARHTYAGSVVRNGKFHLTAYRGQPNNLGDCSVNWNLKWGGRTCYYDFASGVWSFGTMGGDSADGVAAPYTPWTEIASSCLDPVTGNIAIVGSARDGSGVRIWIFNPDNDTFLTGPLVSTALVSGGSLIYHDPSDSFYYLGFSYNSGVAVPVSVYKIVVDCVNMANTTVTAIPPSSSGPSATWGGPTGFAYDSVNDVIGGQPTNGTFYTFNLATLSWTAKTMLLESGTRAPNFTGYCLDFDTANGCYVWLDKPASGTGQTTWAYRP